VLLLLPSFLLAMLDRNDTQKICRSDTEQKEQIRHDEHVVAKPR
jgi:hypothetical protein